MYAASLQSLQPNLVAVVPHPGSVLLQHCCYHYDLPLLLYCPACCSIVAIIAAYHCRVRARASILSSPTPADGIVAIIMAYLCRCSALPWRCVDLVLLSPRCKSSRHDSPDLPPLPNCLCSTFCQVEKGIDELSHSASHSSLSTSSPHPQDLTLYHPNIALGHLKLILDHPQITLPSA